MAEGSSSKSQPQIAPSTVNMFSSLLFQTSVLLPLQRSRHKRYHHEYHLSPIATAKTNLSLATTAPVSETAIEAIRTAYTTSNAAIHHGTCAHSLGRTAAHLYEEARKSVARLINASDSSQIIFAPSQESATELFARSFSSILTRGDEIVLTAAEPDFSRRIWASVAIRNQLKIRVLYPDHTGEILFDEIASALSSRTRLVVLQAACPLIGAFAPLEELMEFISGAGVPILLNTTHALQYALVDVNHVPAAFVIADGASLGAPNSAFLYGRQEQLKRLPPCFGGDEVLQDFAVDADLAIRNWSDTPERFHVGMPSISCAAALRAVADNISDRQHGSFIRRCEDMASHLGRKLIACPRVVLYGAKAERRIPIASFNVEGVEGRLLADELKKKGMDVECGCHEARMAHMQYLDCPSSLRVAFDPKLHQIQDVDNFVNALAVSIQTLV